jgi:hypothetical protein
MATFVGDNNGGGVELQNFLDFLNLDIFFYLFIFLF